MLLGIAFHQALATIQHITHLQLYYDSAAEMPQLPTEIVSLILEHLIIQDKPILIIPAGRDYSQAHMIFGGGNTQIIPGSNLQRPTPTSMGSAPPLDLLLVDKTFHDLSIKLYYGKNTFSLLDGTHAVDLLNLIGSTKAAMIRHIALESRWEFSHHTEETYLGLKYYLRVHHRWGRCNTDDLASSTPSHRGVFPKLNSISLRIRHSWPQPISLVFTALPPPSTLPRNPLLLHKPETAEFSWTPALGENWRSSRQMHQAIATSIKKLWQDLNMQSHLPMARIGFKIVPIQEEWNECIPTAPLESL
jgi:hypothetical protein